MLSYFVVERLCDALNGSNGLFGIIACREWAEADLAKVLVLLGVLGGVYLDSKSPGKIRLKRATYFKALMMGGRLYSKQLVRSSVAMNFLAELAEMP